MKKLIIALTAIIAMASCKKEKVAPTPTPTVTKNLAKEVRIYDGGAPETDNYTYDVQRRMAEAISDTKTESFNYLSATSILVTEKKKSDNSLVQTKECELNASGYITKMIFKNPAGSVTYTYIFTYNAEGYQVSYKGFSPGGSSYETEYTYVDGNPVSSKLFNNGVQTGTEQFTYDNTKENKMPYSSTFSYWPSYTLFGKHSKNLCVKYMKFDMAHTLTFHTQNVFEIDAQG